MVRRKLSDNPFNGKNLKSELENAGFEDFITENIVARVTKKKTDIWTAEEGYIEAIREIQIILNSTKAAFDNFKLNTGSRAKELEQTSYT